MITFARRRRPVLLVPLWRRILQEADASTPSFLRLWRRSLHRFRQSLSQEALVQALDTHPLEAASTIAAT